MEKVLKLINSILIVIIILLVTTNVVFAKPIIQVADQVTTQEQQGGLNLNDYKPGAITGADTLKNFGNIIIGFLQLIGSIVSVIVLIIIGIKYLVGSIEERAQYKETMMPYIIGAILVFSITNILKIISDIMSNV